jgi:predicted nucleic acid-binding protein
VTTGSTDAVVVDTMVMSWLIHHDPRGLKDRYRQLIGQARIVLALQTVAELRAGALLAEWGELRTRRLERSLATADTAQPDDATATAYARLRRDCQRAGHALAGKIHDGDRWIAATAVRLDVPVVSHDALFRNVPGLVLITANTE